MIRKQKKQETDKYVLAFDPGGTTGMALLRYNSKEVSLHVLGQVGDEHVGFYDNFYGIPAGLGTPVTVVSEKWVEHGIKGVDRTPLVIEGIQYAFWPDAVEYQTPDMKQMIPDQLLKDIGVWTEGKPHQMDALRHALIWLRNQEHMPTLKLLGEEGQQMQCGGGSGGTPQQIEGGASDGEGEGDGTPEDGQPGEGEGQSYVPTLTEMQQALAFIQEQMDEEQEDYIAGLLQETQKVYERERDLDGAFSGYQADPNESRTMMIDEDF